MLSILFVSFTSVMKRSRCTSDEGWPPTSGRTPGSAGCPSPAHLPLSGLWKFPRLPCRLRNWQSQRVTAEAQLPFVLWPVGGHKGRVFLQTKLLFEARFAWLWLTLPSHSGAPPAGGEAGAHPRVPPGAVHGVKGAGVASSGFGHTRCHTGPGPPCSALCLPCLAPSLAHSWCLMSVYEKETEKGSKGLKERKEREKRRRKGQRKTDQPVLGDT